MKRLLFIMVVLITMSCSSTKKTKEVSSPNKAKIATFVEEYVEQNKTNSEKYQNYVNHYREYLETVDTIFSKSGDTKGFDLYLNSLRNNSQILADANNNLPSRYRREMRRRPDMRSTSYKLYKTKVLTELYDRLSQKRHDKLKGELDAVVFEELLKNNQTFNNQHKPEPEEQIFYPL